MAVSPTGQIVVADQASIRVFDTALGLLSVIAGNLSVGVAPAPAPSGSVALGAPIGPVNALHIDNRTGDVYFLEGTATIRVIRAGGPTAGLITTIAGTGASSPAVVGALATETGFSDIYDVCTTPGGDVIIAENDNFRSPRVLRVSARDGRVSVVAGDGATVLSDAFAHAENYFASGAPATTPLLGATAVYASPSGVVYFADNFRLVRADPVNGTLTVLAGQVGRGDGVWGRGWR